MKRKYVQRRLFPAICEATERSASDRNRIGGECGSTLVEFAFVAVFILFPLVFGIIDFARAAYDYHYVAYAAGQAARWASVRGSQCANSLPAPCEATSGAGGTVDAYVRDTLSTGVDVDTSPCSGTAGCLVVTTTWPGAPAGSSATSSCTGGAGSNSQGCVVGVEIQYTFGFDLPFLPQTVINLSSASETVISQ